ncbi:phosphate ABC transporter substrate-binding protein [Fischerella thermalis CCMEE 5201]|jgi:phosphate transport system substrate-binding protein|nr:phosphate ABC transporter substrate-binding protein [Fischerella thermalis CCMEE 5201]
MDNTNQRRIPFNGEIALFLRGLIIGKILTILVLGGVAWWLLRPYTLVRKNTVATSSQNSNPASPVVSNFQSVANVPVASVNYGGSTAWAPIRQLVDSQIQSDRPELQLRYQDPNNGIPSSSSGIRMLLDGQLDFAQSSRPLTESEYSLAKQRGFTLEQRQIGTDGIAVVVNPSLQVPGLTVDQLQQIYLGQITNWKQVGGPDLPITPFSQRLEKADSVIFSRNQNLQNLSFSSNVKYVSSTTEALRQVSKIPGGIYYASARAVVPQCTVKPLPLGLTSTELIPPYSDTLVTPDQCPRQRNQINTEAIKNGSYPITTNLFVIIKQNNGQAQQVGEVYTQLLLTDQGQKAIERAGFVGVR